MTAGWPDDQWQIATKMARQGDLVPAIAKAVMRSPKAVERQFEKRGLAGLIRRTNLSAVIDHSPENMDRAIIPESVRDDRDRRADLRPRSLTAFCFGDPLPGCSALDARR